MFRRELQSSSQPLVSSPVDTRIYCKLCLFVMDVPRLLDGAVTSADHLVFKRELQMFRRELQSSSQPFMLAPGLSHKPAKKVALFYF